MKEVLQKNSFEFKKKFGQNFISDTNLLKAIVKEGELSSTDQVLEIGPGAGTLTEQISQVVDKVVSYEIDTSLQPVLQETLKDCPNSTIIFGDIMQQDLAQVESHFSNGYHLVANLPYYITTPIIFKFINHSTKIKSLYVMVQKEVGERICANPDNKDYGILSVIIASIGSARITRVINRNMFYPVPNVDSCMVKIDINRDKFQIDDFKDYGDFIQKCFAMRRKTLANNLEKAYSIPRQTCYDYLTKLNLPQDARAEKLTPKNFVDLYNMIKNK